MDMNCVINNNYTHRVRKLLENKTNLEDDRISYLEAQLAQARQIAEDSDKKYEEVRIEYVKRKEMRQVRAHSDDKVVVVMHWRTCSITF